MEGLEVRMATHGDAERIVSLNLAAEAVTSPMDVDRFRHLFDLSAVATVAVFDGEVVGFLLGMVEGIAYDNGNYRWFDERIKRFVYVDRIVVGESQRGLGVGRALYGHIFQWTEQTDRLSIVAEIDCDPPNESSLRFHQRCGFVEIGTRSLTNGKTVSMQLRTLEFT